jgi:hypothetical protein
MSTRTYDLVGAGGTGSILYPLLKRYLTTYEKTSGEPFRITIIDGKEVAAAKLDRQLFEGRYSGSNKAEALVAQYQDDPKVVIAVPSYLNDQNIGGIRNGDVVLIAADNYPVRARIERHAATLDNITVINGGNEMRDGSLQIYMRRKGKNVTPPMSRGHAEILEDDKRDPAALSCEQIAALPGGEQTIIANMMSATAMLNGLHMVHTWERPKKDRPAHFELQEEVFFDLNTFAMRATTRPL